MASCILQENLPAFFVEDEGTRLTADPIQLAAVTAGLEHISRDNASSERTVLGVDSGHFRRKRGELREWGADGEAAGKKASVRYCIVWSSV